MLPAPRPPYLRTHPFYSIASRIPPGRECEVVWPASWGSRKGGDYDAIVAQNRLRNLSFGGPGGSRKGSWRGPGRVLEGSWEDSGGVWRNLGGPWVVLEIFRAILKALGPILGPFWDPRWNRKLTQIGSQKASKFS